MSSSGPPHVHAPHGGVHNWRDFFVHIAIITIGLLLALGLEQVAQSIHRASQRAELEAQMHKTLESNEKVNRQTLETLGNVRGFLAALHKVVVARRKGQSASAPNPPSNFYVTLTTLGPIEAAKENGTIAVLDVDRIRLYNRVAFQQGIVRQDLDDYRHSMRSLRAFRKRFNTDSDTQNLQFNVPMPDLALLSSTELVEYTRLIADAIEANDQFALRLLRLNNQTRALIDGAGTEEDLIKATIQLESDQPKAPPRETE